MKSKSNLMCAVIAAAFTCGSVMAQEKQPGGTQRQGEENARLTRLTLGLLGVTDIHLGSSLLGKNPHVSTLEEGHSGAPTLRFVTKGVRLEIDSVHYLITLYANQEVENAEMKKRPKDKWTPPKKLIDDFLAKVNLFEAFGIKEYQTQFPAFVPEAGGPDGAFGATFTARRRHGKYAYEDDRIVVRLSYDGKQFMQYIAAFTPTPPENTEVGIDAARARASLRRVLEGSRGLKAFNQKEDLRLRDESLTVTEDLRYVHPNAFLIANESPLQLDYKTSGAARLAYVCTAVSASDEREFRMTVWIDAKDGKPLGGAWLYDKKKPASADQKE